MNFFQKVGEVDVLPLANTLLRNRQLWGADRLRQNYDGSAHVDTDDIWVRFDSEVRLEDGRYVGGPIVFQPAAAVLGGVVKPIVSNLAARFGAYAVDRVLVTRLAPGKTIKPHIDAHSDYTDDPHASRFHVVVQGLPGALFHSGGETVQMRTGEVWWFEHRVLHSVENHSADDRIHLLVDLRAWP